MYRSHWHVRSDDVHVLFLSEYAARERFEEILEEKAGDSRVVDIAKYDDDVAEVFYDVSGDPETIELDFCDARDDDDTDPGCYYFNHPAYRPKGA